MGEIPSLQQLHHNAHQLSIRATLQAIEIKSILAEISHKISYWPSPPPLVMSPCFSSSTPAAVFSGSSPPTAPTAVKSSSLGSTTLNANRNPPPSLQLPAAHSPPTALATTTAAVIISAAAPAISTSHHTMASTVSSPSSTKTFSLTTLSPNSISNPSSKPAAPLQTHMSLSTTTPQSLLPNTSPPPVLPSIPIPKLNISTTPSPPQSSFITSNINTPPVQPINTPKPLLSPPALPSSSPTANPSPKPTIPAPYPIRYLTYSDMQQRRDHDLCLNCDEHYTRTHHCQTPRILLVLPDDDSNLKPHPLGLIEPTDLEQNKAQESLLNALINALNQKAQRGVTSTFSHPAATLFDTGSFPNHIHSRTALFLALKIAKSSTIFVSIGNEEKRRSKRSCPNGRVLYLLVLVEYKIKLGESKVFIFDPGGLFKVGSVFEMRSIYVDAHLTTMRTWSVSKGMVMIRLGLDDGLGISLCGSYKDNKNSNGA